MLYIKCPHCGMRPQTEFSYGGDASVKRPELNKDISEVGTTVFSPPYTPISIGALAGKNVNKHFRPLRVTPMH